jgi:hypothetical protein
MTKEELEEAADHAETKMVVECNGDYTKFKKYKDGFRDGYNAGKLKWHKVADGDLPKDENDVLIYSGEDWRMCVGRYSPKYKAWETGCDTIAWCEIPTFDKE